MSEFDLIAKYFTRPSSRGDVLLSVGDDAAVLQVPPDRRLVAAVDTIVADVHFPAGIAAEAIGHRALAVNLSDMAAMGAEPTWMTLSLSLPANDATWLEGFSRGLYELAARHNVALVGGDTVRGSLSVTVQILGLVATDRWMTRAGARPGDTIFVSGVPGESAAGLALLQRSAATSLLGNSVSSKSVNGSDEQYLMQRFLWPEPRVHLGCAIRTIASAAIDVSDGLLADLAHIAERSDCGAQIDLESLPQSSAVSALFSAEDGEQLSLSGGDDYELLFTVPDSRIQDVETLHGVRCTPIGRMIEGKGVICRRAGKPVAIARHGYDHFA